MSQRRRHALVERALEDLGPLPVLGGTVARIRALCADPAATTEEIVAAVESDESFAANLLSFANSAFYLRPVPAATIRQAVMLVGRAELARTAVTAATYQFLEKAPGNGGVSRGQMHLHAVAVASGAVATAERAGVDIEAVHLAGLLHDVGKLVMPLAFGEGALEAIAAVRPAGARRAELERNEFGIDHAYAGSLLALASQASEEVADAIAFHHGGRSSQDCPNAVAACVQIANCLVGMIAGLEPDHEVLNLALAKLDLSMDALDELGGAVAGQASESPSGLTARVQKLERLVGEDPLTGVANRRHWLELLGGRLRAGHDLAVIICDVDHFKELNDRFGHATGDAVLIGVANVLGAAGTVGRLGGDEFALFVPGSVEDGVAAAQGAMEALNAGLPDLDAAALVSLSMGVSGAPGHGTEPSELLRRADEALYEAKRSGRSRVAAAQ